MHPEGCGTLDTMTVKNGGIGMNSALQNLTVQYSEAREAVKSVFRMESEYSYPVAANLYVSANVPVDPDRLEDCKRLIKAEAGIFSNFRGNIKVPLAAKLALSDDPQSRWMRAEANYEMLKEHFMRSEFLALAALLLTDSAADADVPALAARGKALYSRMRKEHPFLTGQEDSVFAILLAQSDRTDDALIADMEACYRLLDERFFKGDGIQTASHVLAMIGGTPEEKANKVIALYDAIRDAGGKYGKNWELSALAAFATDDTPVETIVSEMLAVDALLEGQKGYGIFGCDRKTRMMHAAMLVSAYHSREQTGLVNAIAQQSAVAMIAAQQAAICAMIACSSASAAAAAGAH